MKKRILALDPGTSETGWAAWDGKSVGAAGVMENHELRSWLQQSGRDYDHLAIEMIASYGMPVGAEVFETCVWIGRFIEQWWDPNGAMIVFRKEVKMHLCGSPKAKDGNVRQALLDLFPRTGGGAVPQVGIKKQPGPLFGISSHAWPALGVAMVALERIKHETPRAARHRPASRRIPLL